MVENYPPFAITSNLRVVVGRASCCFVEIMETPEMKRGLGNIRAPSSRPSPRTPTSDVGAGRREKVAAGRLRGKTACYRAVRQVVITKFKSQIKRPTSPRPSPRRRGRIVLSFFENSGDWICRMRIREIRNVRLLFLLLGEKVRMRAVVITIFKC